MDSFQPPPPPSWTKTDAPDSLPNAVIFTKIISLCIWSCPGQSSHMSKCSLSSGYSVKIKDQQIEIKRKMMNTLFVNEKTSGRIKVINIYFNSNKVENCLSIDWYFLSLNFESIFVLLRIKPKIAAYF